MEQNNNIENQFKQKLNQRTIEPSDKAWDRLDAMLSVSEKKKSKKTWLWIAASLIVFVSIGSLFLRTDNSELITNYEVTITNDEVTANDELVITNDEIITDHTPEIVIERKKSTLTTFNDNLNSNDNLNTENTEIANTDDIDFDIETIEKEEKIRSNKYISAENLLVQIEKEEIQETKKLQPKINIDANTLLTNTIKEMDEEHQDKAFNNFKQQFQNIKEAFVNRNKE